MRHEPVLAELMTGFRGLSQKALSILFSVGDKPICGWPSGWRSGKLNLKDARFGFRAGAARRSAAEMRQPPLDRIKGMSELGVIDAGMSATSKSAQRCDL